MTSALQYKMVRSCGVHREAAVVTVKVTNPTPTFQDARGLLLDGGQVFVGVANGDPRQQPLTLYSDRQLTQALAQPVRTVGGYLVSQADMVEVFLQADDYSMLVLDHRGAQVFYNPSLYANSTVGASQPLDSDLTAISAQGTNEYGRGLLLLADQAALRAATGIPNPLPLTGGQMTGGITRQGAGAYAYGAQAELTGMRIFNPLPVGTADPTSQPGDIVGFY